MRRKKWSRFFTFAIEVIPPESSGRLRILGAEVKKFNTKVLVKIDRDDITSIVDIATEAFIALGMRGFLVVSILKWTVKGSVILKSSA